MTMSKPGVQALQKTIHLFQVFHHVFKPKHRGRVHQPEEKGSACDGATQVASPNQFGKPISL
jgi:hypothetical protein